MKKLITMAAFAAVTLSFALSNPVFAETANSWYVSPTISYIDKDNARPNQDSTDHRLNFAIGKEVSEHFNIEFDYGHSTSINSVELDALLFLNRESKFAPYFTAGIGFLNTDLENYNNSNPTWSGGLGALTKLGSGEGVFENVNLRTEVRMQKEIDTNEFTYDDLIYSVGLSFPFGEKAKPLPVKPMVKDTDGDGVNDADDKCPATPAGTAVNSFGCELDSDNDGVVDSKDQCPNTARGVAVNKNGCKIDGDSDKDGVKDSMDQCPNTLAGTVVDARGCPVDPDSDNDGVPNSEDQCPATPMGARVDFKGCEIKQVISLPNVNFELNSAKLTASSVATLDGAAETLNKFTDINAEVAGHTDSTGADAYNMSLSDKRAKSVKDYLIGKGVSAARLSSKGFGETQPIADNSNKQGRAMNRRVVLNVIK